MKLPETHQHHRMHLVGREFNIIYVYIYIFNIGLELG